MWIHSVKACLMTHPYNQLKNFNDFCLTSVVKHNLAGAFILLKSSFGQNSAQLEQHRP